MPSGRPLQNRWRNMPYSGMFCHVLCEQRPLRPKDRQTGKFFSINKGLVDFCDGLTVSEEVLDARSDRLRDSGLIGP